MAGLPIMGCRRRLAPNRSLCQCSHPPAAVSLAATGSQLWPSLDNFLGQGELSHLKRPGNLTPAPLGGLQPLTGWHGSTRLAPWPQGGIAPGALPAVWSLWSQAKVDFWNHVFVQLLPLPILLSSLPHECFQCPFSIHHWCKYPYLSLLPVKALVFSTNTHSHIVRHRVRPWTTLSF